MIGPDRVTAASWTIAGAIVVIAFAWVADDSAGNPVALLALSAAIVLTATFAVQAVMPPWWRLILGRERIGWRIGPWAGTVPWTAVRTARITRGWGDERLVLGHERGAATGRRPGWPAAAMQRGRSVVTIPLPVGYDRDALERVLATRLGEGRLPPPAPLTPIDLRGAT